MILQYKGYKHNWVYEEADRIVSTRLNLNDVLGDLTKRKKNMNLEEIKDENKIIEEYIRNETGDLNGEIDYLLGDNMTNSDLEVITVVMLKDNIYVFDGLSTKEVYLLNNSGKTIAKLNGVMMV